jgi:hypothetical protein
MAGGALQNMQRLLTAAAAAAAAAVVVPQELVLGTVAEAWTQVWRTVTAAAVVAVLAWDWRAYTCHRTSLQPLSWWALQ